MKTRKWFKPATTLVGAGILAVALASPINAQQGHETVAAVTVGAQFLDVEAQADFDTAILRVSGPQGYAARMRVNEGGRYLTADLLLDAEPAGNINPQLIAMGEATPQQWSSLVDGRYYYEVVFTFPGGDIRKVSGEFEVVGGAAQTVPQRDIEQDESLGAFTPAAEIHEPNWLERGIGAVLDFIVPSAHAQVQAQNIEIQNSTPPYLRFLDTFGGNQDTWRTQGWDTHYRIQFEPDGGSTTTPFRIDAGVPSDVIRINATGNVGINTTTPAARLHVVSSTSRFESTGGDAWNLNPGPIGFWLNEVGGQSGIIKAQVGATANSLVMTPSGVGVGTDAPAFPLHVQSTAPDVFRISTNTTNVDFQAGPNGLFIADTDGDAIFWAQHARSLSNNIWLQGNGAGFGTSSPQTPIHVFRSDNTANVRVEDSGAGSPQVMFQLLNNGFPQFNMQDTSQTDVSWSFRLSGTAGSTERFTITKVGTGQAEFELFADGSANFQGDVTANGVLLTSTREAKTDFRELDERDVLDKLASLEISQWRYKHEDEGTTHFGPVAEEFHEVFGLSDGKRLNMIDTNGIAFAAIKALNTENEALKAENREIKDRLAALERSLLD
ncbi:MAG: hypothetical protein GVY32_01060 [Gammaproteobacteria bacterium]|jgi:hypothetical protein|nr:hypothetical protein [Gammaproteobacteria bacterium]